MSDKRETQRKGADYRFEFCVAGRDQRGTGQALDQSETGMSFLTDRPLEPGTNVTVRVPIHAESTAILLCLANVVRCLTQPDGNGYAVGCAYD